MKIHSLKFRLSLIMAAVITIVVVLICVFNYAFFEKYLSNDTKTILDIGFGSGRDSLYFSKKYDVYPNDLILAQ